MSEQKKSRWQQFIEYVASSKKPDKSGVNVEKLPDGMVKLVLDQKLKERENAWDMTLEILNKAVDDSTLNNYTDDLTDIVKVAGACVSRMAIPYIRAGDKSDGTQLTSGWMEIYTFFLSECEKAKRFWGNNEPIDRKKRLMSMGEIHVRNLHISIINHYITLANKVIAFSFKDMDVRPSNVTIITPPPTGFGNQFDVNKMTENMS